MFTTNDLGIHVLARRPDSFRYWKQAWEWGLPMKMCTGGRHPGAQLNQNTAYKITGSGKKGKCSTQARKLKTRGTKSMVSHPSGYKDHLGELLRSRFLASSLKILT